MPNRYPLTTDNSNIYFNQGSGEESLSVVARSLVDTDGYTKIQIEESADEDKIRFDTAGSERMVLDGSGFLGIGQAVPTARVHSKGSHFR